MRDIKVLFDNKMITLATMHLFLRELKVIRQILFLANKKGLTELSESNLVRPFSLVFYLSFLDNNTATDHILPE